MSKFSKNMNSAHKNTPYQDSESGVIIRSLLSNFMVLNDILEKMSSIIWLIEFKLQFWVYSRLST